MNSSLKIKHFTNFTNFKKEIEYTTKLIELNIILYKKRFINTEQAERITARYKT